MRCFHLRAISAGLRCVLHAFSGFAWPRMILRRHEPKVYVISCVASARLVWSSGSLAATRSMVVGSRCCDQVRTRGRLCSVGPVQWNFFFCFVAHAVVLMADIAPVCTGVLHECQNFFFVMPPFTSRCAGPFGVWPLRLLAASGPALRFQHPLLCIAY